MHVRCPFLHVTPPLLPSCLHHPAEGELKGRSGAYLQDCAAATPSKRAQDAALAAGLWAKTEELLLAALLKAGIVAIDD